MASSAPLLPLLALCAFNAVVSLFKTCLCLDLGTFFTQLLFVLEIADCIKNELRDMPAFIWR